MVAFSTEQVAGEGRAGKDLGQDIGVAGGGEPLKDKSSSLDVYAAELIANVYVFRTAIVGGVIGDI